MNRIANKNAQEKIQVVLDTSDYRVNRKQRLQRLALRLSRRKNDRQTRYGRSDESA